MLHKNANNTKILVRPDTSLRSWCMNNHYSYAWAYQRIMSGYSFEQIEKDAVHYFCKPESLSSLKNRWAKMLQLNYDRLIVRRELEDKVPEGSKSDLYEILLLKQWKIDESIEYWLPVKNAPHYEVSSFGRFRRVFQGFSTFLHPYSKHSKRKGKKLIKRGINIGSKRNVSPGMIVLETFMPRPSKKHVVEYLNGNQSSIYLDNLRWVTLKDHGHHTGYSKKRSKAVVHLDDQDAILKTYRSARDAAKHLYLSYQTVLDYCHGRVKNPILNVRFVSEEVSI